MKQLRYPELKEELGNSYEETSRLFKELADIMKEYIPNYYVKKREKDKFKIIPKKKRVKTKL